MVGRDEGRSEKRKSVPGSRRTRCVRGSGHWLLKEIQAVLAFFVLALIKIVRQETWEAFIADIYAVFG